MPPLYNFECPNCKHIGEYTAKITEYKSAAPVCEKCGTKTENRFASGGVTVIFNGNGWPGEQIRKQRLHNQYVTGQKNIFKGE